MNELQSAGRAKNHLDPLPVRSFMQELCMSLDFTAEPRFLNQSAFDWLTQEGYLSAQLKENGQYWAYQPTLKGAGLGLRSAQFTAKDGNPYFEIVCGEQGQLLLRDSIEPIIAVERTQWEPLLACLTPEWHRRTSISGKPILLTNMVKQINSCLPGDLPRKLNVQRLSAWLVKNGLMETVVIRGDKKRQPTAVGEKIGISSNLWNKNGSVLWSAPAQQFVLDNLNGIIQDLASGEAYRWGPRDLVLSEDFRRKLRPVPKLLGLAYLEVAINSALGGEKGYPDVLPKKLIISWLYREKYIIGKEKPGGGWIYLPTEKGTMIGLVVSEGHLRLSEAGQQFIYDNLQQIFDYCKTL